MEINILGFGVMGRQIAALLQLLGHDVCVWTRARSPESASRYAFVLKLMRRMSGFAPGEPGKIRFIDSLRDLQAGLTLEALAEDMAVKRQVFAALPFDAATAGFFSNTSSLSPADIGDGVVGLHFFNPVHAVRLVEVTAARESLPEPARGLLARLEENGFDVVTVKGNAGYVANYILFSEIAAALRLVEQHGYDAGTIDRVLTRLGRTTSLFDIIDLIGADVTRDILQSLSAVNPAFSVSPILARAIDQGVLGGKNKTSIRSMIKAEGS